MSDDRRLPWLATFEPLVNFPFSVELDGRRIGLTLVEAQALPPATRRTDLGIRNDPFSLVFRAENSVNLPQNSYEVNNDTLGSTRMFLVPIGFGECQAVFN